MKQWSQKAVPASAPPVCPREDDMTSKALWSRILISVGGAAMLIGAIDPLEGSLLILPGSGLVALGVFLGTPDRRVVRYALWVFILIFSVSLPCSR
ncbi:hypothetical protein E3O32_05455 [Cryobacterium mannosilyticum]|uniref:Uncharacterized protein n=2 Tax=Cryobacterium mannosilyticum TaxID=1259190 RepID=A0A4R8WBJ7_9MICO|nr:hypothetical protein E3O32_05455 [Cryobacterium mannosilyticum]